MIDRLLHYHGAAAGLLAAAVVVAGLTWSTRVAAGADAYGYVSQADLWLRGELSIDQSFAARVPWPSRRWTFTPLGYRPEPDGDRIVPSYPPGLPILMAAAKTVAGHCAIFWIVPMAGGVIVLSTYWIGRRMRRPLVGLAAASIVAASPAVLFMLMAPMSDVPAAAAWAVAVACLIAEAPLAAGLAAAVAILIRPNLVPLAAVLLIFSMFVMKPWRSVLFGATAATGGIAIALVNAHLYGSPLASGYGDSSDAYLWSYVLPNLQRYPWWLVTAETPLALAGLAVLFLPIKAVWPAPEARRVGWLLAACAGVVWLSYIVYLPWDAWWYLRFLLPAWPMMAIGTASLLAALYRSPLPVRRYAAVGAVLLLTVIGVGQAVRRGVFTQARGEAKYVEVARVIEALAGPDDVIITLQYSGSARYYAERLTLRWDLIEPGWLDETVRWLDEHGHRPYLVLEAGEVAPFRARFGAESEVARLDWAPLVSFRGGSVKLYDAVSRDRTTPPVEQSPLGAVEECLPQRPWPQLR